MENVNRKGFRSGFSRARVKERLPKANIVLLVFTLLLIFVVPVLPQNIYINYILTSGILLSAVSLLKKHHNLLMILAVLIPLVVLVGKSVGLEVVGAIFKGLQFFFFIFLVGSLIVRVSGTASVTLEVIIESVVGYLLLGFAFTIIVGLVDKWIPGAYNIPMTNGDQMSILHDNIYYTFITFTTTGYGDMLPLQPVSKSLTILISVTGQLYLAIIIAMLVGKYASIGQESL